MRRFLVLILAGLALSAGGCRKAVIEPKGLVAAFSTGDEAKPARGSDSQAMASLGYVAGGKAASAAAPAPKQNRSPAIPRKLLRTVDLQLEVKDSVDVAKRVEALVNGMGGYVSSSNAQRQGELFVYSLTLRVPSDQLDRMLNTLRSFAVRVNREHQQVEDVTDRYIDLDAHRRTLAETETELRGLLAESRQKGRKADEIMEIYEKLVEIRTEIEQIQTQLSSYDKLAALSTINLELTPTEAAKPVADQSWQPADSLRSSIRKLIDFLQWLVDFLIFAAIVLVPVALAMLVGFLVLRWLWRRLGRPFRRVRRVPPPPTPPGGGSAVP